MIDPLCMGSRLKKLVPSLERRAKEATVIKFGAPKFECERGTGGEEVGGSGVGTQFDSTQNQKKQRESMSERSP